MITCKFATPYTYFNRLVGSCLTWKVLGVQREFHSFKLENVATKMLNKKEAELCT